MEFRGLMPAGLGTAFPDGMTMRQADPVNERIDEAERAIGASVEMGMRTVQEPDLAKVLRLRGSKRIFCHGITMTTLPNDRPTSSPCFDGFLKKRIQIHSTNDCSASDADAPQLLGAQ